jgi:hypothetical protein
MRSIRFKLFFKVMKGWKLAAIVSIFLLFLTSSGCSPEKKIIIFNQDQDFKDYWYQGKAELNRYDLEQARYGQIHKGSAVLIFVTEDFLTDKQVKLEHGKSKNSTTVLKLNSARKFVTGIYPYSILTSVFTPVDLLNWKHTLKVSNSNQEWCGNTYVQLNYRDGKYQGLGHSYFQDEADQTFSLDSNAILEDETWTRIRLSPHSLPVGEINILPGLYFIRFRHLGFKIHKATTQFATINEPGLSPDSVEVYSIKYLDIDRSLKIMFERKFPYSILGWEETFKSGWGANAKELTTRAKRTNTLVTDYWTKHSVADSTYRKALGF